MPLPGPLPGPAALLTLPLPTQSSVKLKLICAQVLRDLLGEAIEVSEPLGVGRMGPGVGRA